MNDRLELDGQAGGGQILRTALALSMVTGRGFRLRAIRGARPKPGLMRQHLAAVMAAATLCDAQMEGAELGSTELCFVPGALRAGEFSFAIGSAGSTTLLLQTLLPALLMGQAGDYRIDVSGGTHNPLAPSADFLMHSFLPLLREMGADVSMQLERHGFYPAGGGRIVMQVRPRPLRQPLELLMRGALLHAEARALVANLATSIGRREIRTLRDLLDWPQECFVLVPINDCAGPGNLVELRVTHERLTELICSHGRKSQTAEDVARQAVQQLQHYLDSPGAVGEYLADQLMLPLALAGGGRFTTRALSAHMVSNAALIERFLPVCFRFTRQEHQLMVELLPRAGTFMQGRRTPPRPEPIAPRALP